jgi:putative transport protein
MREILRAHPEIAFFAVIGLGYLIGRLRVGRFSVGAVTGTLLAGVAVGQAGITVSGDVKQCFFLLFLFAVGFRTGPQFFRGLKRNGVQHATLAAIVATSGLAAAYLVCRLLGYDAGTAAGVLAGSLTNSPAIGTASDALTRAGAADMINHIAAAYAVTYLIGVVGAAWFLAYAAPRIMGVDLKESCRRYERERRGAAVPNAPRSVEYRAYLVEPASPMIGHCRPLGVQDGAGRAPGGVRRRGNRHAGARRDPGSGGESGADARLRSGLRRRQRAHRALGIADRAAAAVAQPTASARA